MTTDTIIAAATPPGISGVAVLRISGAHACAALECIGGTTPKPRYASLQRLINPETGKLIDEALILWFPAPHSFTGEDVVELHVHGSRVIQRLILDVLLKQGQVRIAEPGEFSRRAFLNGKMDLTEAEGLADMIAAQTERQHRQAADIVQGHLHRQYEGWREQLVHAQAQLEAYIDFPDEDLPQELTERIARELQALHKDIECALEQKSNQMVREGVRIGIFGEPNVGKSSLLNYLARQDVAIVTEEAGTTRDIVEVTLDIAGYPVIISDTAGLREANNRVEQEGIRRAISLAERVDFKIILVNPNNSIPETIEAMIDESAILVMNKCDILKDQEMPQKLKNLGAIAISLKNMQGLDVLLEKIENTLDDKILDTTAISFTREHHKHALHITCDRIATYLSSQENNIPLELRAEELRLAGRALGSITGVIDVEEMLDVVFKEFCIGK